jgi:hypothetical protein
VTLRPAVIAPNFTGIAHAMHLHFAVFKVRRFAGKMCQCGSTISLRFISGNAFAMPALTSFENLLLRFRWVPQQICWPAFLETKNTKEKNMNTFTQTTATRRSEFLNLRRLPARLDSEQTAMLLGLAGYELVFIMRAKLLLPLGRPSQNGRKYFAACVVQELMTNVEWLNTATRTVQKHIHDSNFKQRSAGRIPFQQP